eukprot:9252694-Pyramimonas_sp.AAC.1
MQLTQVSLHVVQYNARLSHATFTHGTAGKQRRARNKALRLQLQEAKVIVAGIQETRTPRGTRVCD